jgi:hypothetical protein
MMTTPTPVSLDRFLLDGHFGSIALGMDEDAARGLLGPPEGYSTFKALSASGSTGAWS